VSESPEADGFVLLSDQPVSEPDGEDVLGTAAQVKNLVDLIKRSRHSAPFTVAIDADWGMGKSSIMLQLKAALDKLDKKDGVVTSWFNAWTAGDDDALAGLIKSALMSVDENALRRTLRRVARHRSLVVGLRLMLTAVASFFNLARVVDQLWDAVSADASSRNAIRDDLHEIFDNWANNTKRTPKGRLLVVFIDDLDRCSSEVILAVCEAMRLYLAVPGIVFVIGCDQNVLAQAALNSGIVSQAAASLGYLEKIVQITYPKPAPDEQQMSGLVDHYARSSRTSSLFSDQVRHAVVRGTGRNPRRLKRLINSFILEYQLDPVWNSLGPETLITVNLLQHFYTEFYRELTRSTDSDIAHEFLTYEELRNRLLSGSPRTEEDRKFFQTHHIPAPAADGKDNSEAVSRLEKKLPPSFPALADRPEFVQLLSDLVNHKEFAQLMDWLQRRPFAAAGETIISASKSSVGAGVITSVVLAEESGVETGRSSASAALRVPASGELAIPMAVSLAPRPTSLWGREELLADLHARLTGAQDGPQIVALFGLGGVGKTSVALEYAYRRLAGLRVAWQLVAENQATLAANFAELATQLGTVDGRDPVKSAHGVLAALPAEWLLVFDNAPDFPSVQKFLPPAGNGQVLITSRGSLWPLGEAIEVPPLSRDAATAFLADRTGDLDDDAATALADELGGLPLALEQASSYITATGGTLAGYLEVFRQRRQDLLGRGQPAEYGGTVAATWDLAFQALEEHAPTATGLLRLLASCAPAPVPLPLLLNPSAVSGDQLDPDVTGMLGPLLGDSVARADAVAALRRYSLVALAGDEVVIVHRLVQAVTLARMPEPEAAQWRRTAAALIEAAIPANTELPEAWPTCAALLPHALAALPDGSDAKARIATYLADSGSPAAARDLERRIIEARTHALGLEHPDTLTARADAARWTGQAGDLAGARDQFRDLVPVMERVLGSEHPAALTARASLARWTGEAGDPAGARDQFRVLVPVMERVLGSEHPAALTARASLAGWTGEAGDPAGARDQFRDLVPVMERVLGPEHPDTLTARFDLAHWTGGAGDPAAARDQFQELLSIRVRVLGPEHPATLIARAGLAGWTGEADDPAAARDQFRELLPIMERVLGPEHPQTLTARASVARWTGEAGDAAGARDQFAELLPAVDRVLGLEHPDTLTARFNLAHWTGEAGDAAGARDQFAELLPAVKRVLGPKHPVTLLATADLARWTGEAGNTLAARDEFHKLLPIMEQVLGPEHPDILRATRWMRGVDAAA
jgi:hypothetical protein